MTTARDLVTGALRLLGAVASGEAPSAGEATDGLASLNSLIESWSNESLLIPNRVREVFPLLSGQSAYTMGVGGGFNTARPIRIENAEIELPGSSPAAELPVTLLTKDQYARIVIKQLASSLPLYLYAEGTSPLETINVYPVPSSTVNLILYSAKPLSSLALTTALSLPPGYERALRFNLACDLAPEYGKEVPQTVAALAVESKAAIKRTNFRPRYLRVDDALTHKGGMGAGGSGFFAVVSGASQDDTADGGTF